jgi:hypothetical protein
MPLAAENFVQENSGVVTTAGTSCVVSLPSGTTAGNTLVVFLTSLSGVTAPAGFVEDEGPVINLTAFRKSEVAASETSWTFTTGINSLFAWYVVELSGLAPVEPLDASADSGGAFGSTSNGGTRSTGTTALNASLNTVVFAAFSAQQTPAGTTESWSGYTNNFEELADVSPNVDGAYQLAVARKFVTGTTGQFESTATLATSQASQLTGALIVVYRSADSPIAAPLAHLQGFENGTHGGINSHTGPTSLTGAGFSVTSGTWGTNYLIQAASARNSNYGLQITQSGVAAHVRAGDVNAPSGSVGFDVRVVSATGTVVVASLTASTGTPLVQLLYDADASKFGVRCGTTGTTSWQSGTTATNIWVWVDIRWKTNTSTWHAEWRLETGADTYTEQAAAELSGQAATNFYMVELGRASTAQTMTADYDNVCLSRYYVAYPLGPHQIRLLTVDPAGTPTVSGTSSNFSVFTANGTLGAWNATNARDAVDEVPPTVSASADGVCQTATAANDYIEFPMAAPTVAADEVIAGVRMLAAMWGGAGAGTGQVGIRGWDGTTETTLVPASVSYDAGSPTAVSTTEPRWQCAMWPYPTGGWTEALLAGAALRFGFSPDATPDMGTDALYLEYATRKAIIQSLFGTLASAAVNPNTAGVRAVTVDTNVESGKAADLYYEESGSPTTVPVAADTTQIEVIDAPDAPTVNYIALYPE